MSILSVTDPRLRETILPSPGRQRLSPSPVSWEDQVLYFLLPDRFSNGDEAGALDSEGIATSGSVRSFAPSDNANAIRSHKDALKWQANGNTFQGGTLRGILSKLGYLKRLGITTLWVGPIFKQVPTDEHSYHGYGVQNFLEVDPHFGTKEQLRNLVKRAHELGMYVVLDIILNHSGNVFAYKSGEQAWTGQKYPVEGFRDSLGQPSIPFRPLDLRQSTFQKVEDCAIWPWELQYPACFAREGTISNWDRDPEYIRGDFYSLKNIDLGTGNADNFVASPALRTLCEVYKYWIAYADLDGYRIDTVRHMGDGPTRHLCTILHEYASSVGKENFFLVGEVTGSRAFDTVEVTGLDAALAIGNIQEKLWKLPKGYVNPTEYFDLFRNAAYLKKGTDAWLGKKLVTMIDDHDQVWRPGDDKARFCSEGEGDRLVFAAVALNLTTLGIPCIYYGTEQRFDGRGTSDRYIREAMFGGGFGAFRSRDRHFFDESNAVFTEISKITQLRKRYKALRRGRQYLREISSDGQRFSVPHVLEGRLKSIVAWSRVFADHEIVLAINTDTRYRRDAFVAIDPEIHAEGHALQCVYQYPATGGKMTTNVLALGEKAVHISLPPCGFAMYL
ncbi:glycoside hydrolase family 13 protein [Lophiostoma macrostomum CBS 122681]|uniref:Glycoside hydrolase family 13 protein n=1 Tax=Lophiostoma macrostomum CBS 122681 TaxID=1314788 RepID=A0A6A6SZZ6_9PLEO|nr:glycoside hydrolase family 13 protein [Lophiostoma macrostomum CBS 122681]